MKIRNREWDDPLFPDVIHRLRNICDNEAPQTGVFKND